MAKLITKPRFRMIQNEEHWRRMMSKRLKHHYRKFWTGPEVSFAWCSEWSPLKPIPRGWQKQYLRRQFKEFCEVIQAMLRIACRADRPVVECQIRRDGVGGFGRQYETFRKQMEKKLGGLMAAAAKFLKITTPFMWSYRSVSPITWEEFDYDINVYHIMVWLPAKRALMVR